MFHSPLQRRSAVLDRAFTLVEMLVVMAVIAVLIALVAPVTVGLLRGHLVTQSGEMVTDQLILARQAALTNSRVVEMRFYQLPKPGAAAGSPTTYCGVQAVLHEESGRLRPLGKVELLRTGIVFAADGTHSTLLTPPSPATATVSGTDYVPGFGVNQKFAYVGFSFLPNGSTDLDPTAASGSGGWFATLVDSNKPLPTGGVPADFYTLRVEPLDGHVQTFRP